jgi:hypothetical protein
VGRQVVRRRVRLELARRRRAQLCLPRTARGFGDALLLTGDQAYTGVLRRQLDNIYAQQKVVDGKTRSRTITAIRAGTAISTSTAMPPVWATAAEVETDVYMWGLKPGSGPGPAAEDRLDRLSAGRRLPTIR